MRERASLGSADPSRFQVPGSRLQVPGEVCLSETSSDSFPADRRSNPTLEDLFGNKLTGGIDSIAVGG